MKKLASMFLTVIMFLALAALMASAGGCGEDEKPDTSATGTTARTGTATATASVSTSMETTVEVPTPPEPAPAAGSSSAGPVMPLRIIDYNVVPNTVNAGAPLACTVTVEGEATAVIMGLTGPSGSVSQTVNLVAGPASGGITTWSAVTTAPSTVGGWRFGARAIATDGTEVLPDAGGLSASLLPFEVVP